MKKSFLIIAVFALFVSSIAYAEDIELSHDDGKGEGFMRDIPVGSYEGVMFFVEHKAKIKKINIAFYGQGKVEFHIWPDGGGNDPVKETDLITPRTIEIKAADANQWLEIDISDEELEIGALEIFHAGIVRQENGPGIWIDTSTGGNGPSFMYKADDLNVKYGISDGDYMVRSIVEYLDVKTDFTFEDVTEKAGVKSASRVAWGDCDNDGDDDLLIAASKLYKNNGDGTFTDISDSAGITGVSGYGIWADYDNDGILDYYAFSGGTEDDNRDRLVNGLGDCKFAPVNETENVPFDLYPTEAVAWADYDNDGWVDLYTANYELPGDTLSQCTQDALWRNLGNGKFENVTKQVGMHLQTPLCGRGVNWGDFDNDGWIDLYVSNYRLKPNLLWKNNGNGTFTDVSEERRVKGFNSMGKYGHSIGSVWGDFDNDEDLDLLVGNLAHPRFISFSDKTMLNVNTGAPKYIFNDYFITSGISYSETHSDTLWWDYDNDGWLDMFITAIYPRRISFLYKNQKDGTFINENYNTGAWLFNGWGVAYSDFDKDGDLDLMSRKLLKNKLNNSSNREKQHWLQVELKGHKMNSFAIGARVVIKAGDITQMREVEGGKGTGCQSSFIQHFGLGDSENVDEITVRWMNDDVSVMKNVKADQRILIEEDKPECRNYLQACEDETTVKTCVNWKWETKACDSDLVCIEGNCVEKPIPEIDGDLDNIDVDAELSIEADKEEDALDSVEIMENEDNNGGCSQQKTGTIPLMLLLFAIFIFRKMKLKAFA